MILEFIENYQGENLRPPTVREIQAHCKFKSPRAVTYFLEKLEEAKKVIRHTKARGIFLAEQPKPKPVERLIQIPLFSGIPAGLTDPLGAEPDEMFDLSPHSLGVRSPEKAFAVRVRGESMIGAGILSGDIVILEKKEAKVGDIVAALMDGENTLKRLIKKGTKYFLKAENPLYPDLEPVETLAVQGVLVGVIRTFA
jgi:repressor LexA